MSDETSSPRHWAAYAASACGGLYGAVSLYWALGGSAGLRTVGGFAERMAQPHNLQAAAVIWSVVMAKAAGAALPLSLVRPWGAVVPRRWRAVLSGGAGAALSLYGATQVIGETLAELGLVRPAGPVDWLALRWHLELWDPWFLVWGLLLLTATWQFVRPPVTRAQGRATVLNRLASRTHRTAMSVGR
jgi:hypothetical protein